MAFKRVRILTLRLCGIGEMRLGGNDDAFTKLYSPLTGESARSAGGGGCDIRPYGAHDRLAPNHSHPSLSRILRSQARVAHPCATVHGRETMSREIPAHPPSRGKERDFVGVISRQRSRIRNQAPASF